MINKIKISIAENGTWVALIVVIAVFTALNPRFLSFYNGMAILKQVAEIGLIAVALAFVVMAGSIDLSVGSIASLSTVVATMAMVGTGSGWVGILVGLGLGALLGALNGLLISVFNLNPIVVTLGFLAAWGGLARFLTNGATLTGLPAEFIKLNGVLGFIALAPAILIIVIVLAWWLLNRRPVGKWVLAVGDNDDAAFLMGVPTRRVRFLLFVFAGVFSALAGLLLSMRLQATPPAVGEGMELSALTVVLLGGVAFAGGYGRISGVVAGIFFVGVLQNGLVIVGVSQFLQQVAVGLTLVVAIALDKTLRGMVVSSWDNLTRSSDKKAAVTEV